MFCSNCGKQLEDGSKFCPSCGSQISSEPDKPIRTVQISANTAKPTTTAKEKKPINKKAIKLAAFISGGVVLLTAIILLTVLVIVPAIKWNSAVSLMDDGNYVGAFEAFSKQMTEDKYDSEKTMIDLCYAKAVNQLLQDGKVAEAYDFHMTYHYNDYIDFNVDTDKPTISDTETFYNEVIKLLNTKNIFEDYSRGGYFVIAHMLSFIPNNYEDAEILRYFFDDVSALLKCGAAPAILINYIVENPGIIKSLVHYYAIRKLAEENIEAYLSIGFWSSDDDSSYIYFSPEIYYPVIDDDSQWAYKFTFNSKGLETPDVLHKYYTIDGMTLIYTNDNDSKVCDVFRFKLDEENPNILYVYCFANDKTVTLYNE